jgi:hypothetical protein
MNDMDDVLLQTRNSLAGAHMDTPVEAVLARSRSQRHRRRLAGLSVSGIAASTVLALGLAGAFGSASPQPSHGGAHAHLAAFTLASNRNGTVTLTLGPNAPLNPGAIQHALAQHGIPALVKTGSYCYSNPAPANNGAVHTYPKLRGYPPGQQPPTTRLVINPSALAPGTEIGFGFLRHNRLFIQNIIYDNTHTCTSNPPGN